MARILVSGASGFIGKPLLSFLESKNCSLYCLSRSSGKNTITWNPEEGKANPADFEGFDAVIHLAGEPLTLSRWTKKKKEKILFSRSNGTAFLSDLLNSARHPPNVFISASATGYYGNRGEELLTEKSGEGEGFLASVCTAWEKASLPLKGRGVRLVYARFGMVIGSNGGALQKMLLPYKLGLGGSLGTGKQWLSWVDLNDLIRALYFAIENESMEGPINVVSPNPVRQEMFAKILAEALHRPHFFRVPSWVLKILLGTAADEIVLSSSKVQCAKLLAANFVFEYPDLRSAVYKALKKVSTN